MKQMESAQGIVSIIRDYVASSENTLQNPAGDRAFDEPLVGFSAGSDPLYDAYKTHVGPFHWAPLEAFSIAFPQVNVSPEELTVVSWVLPQAKLTKADNRKQTVQPSDRWARARIYGEEFNTKLKRMLVQRLQQEGIAAVAPPLLPDWQKKESDGIPYASNWSERHAAYASGLGTFGLCDGLITPVGKAMRLGSVVVRLQLPATPRPYTDHHAYCLHFAGQTCRKCIERCPVQAISEAGHDKTKCARHLKPVSADYVKSHYGFDGYGCGLCQTGVPCESGIPVRSARIKTAL